MRGIGAVICVALAVSGVAGQTTGVQGVNDLRIRIDNGPFQGGGGTSCVDLPVSQGFHCLRLEITSDPGSCVFVMIGDSCSINSVALPQPNCGSTVDIGNPQVMQACWLPGPPFGGSFFVIPSSGTWENLYCLPFAQGFGFHLQTGVINANGVCTTQAYHVHESPLCSAGTPSGLIADDGSLQYSFTGADTDFGFYGTTYTDMFVNSNGNITFTGGDSDFTESSGEMSSGLPRIATGWDDLSPQPSLSPSGTIGLDETGSTVTVSWFDISGFTVGPNPGHVEICCTLDKVADSVRMSHNAGANTLWNGAISSRDVIVGISPGGGATQDALDLSAAGTQLGGSGHGIWEWLNNAEGPYDLGGKTFLFTPAANNAYTLLNP